MSIPFDSLISELRERFAPGVDVAEVEVYLASRGYDAHQIGEILAAFVAHLADVTPAPVSAPTMVPGRVSAEGPTFRVMGAHERGRFAPEAWGHLIALSASGALGPVEREQVIERALMHIDGRIGLGELRALLEGAGFEDGGPTVIH